LDRLDGYLRVRVRCLHYCLHGMCGLCSVCCLEHSGGLCSLGSMCGLVSMGSV